MKTVSELIDDLFHTHQKPDGSEYSNTEVCRALRGTVDPGHLSKLRRGIIKNPSRDTLLALCTFFRVPATYFFPELEPPDPVSETVQDPIDIVAKATHISPKVKRKLRDLLRALGEDEDEDEGNQEEE